MNDTISDNEIDLLLQQTLDELLAKRRTPASTYRLQFHKDFTFRDAARIVPYLHSLGITHCYASPYLKATPGSTHGYDVVDHTLLNPELGTRADYDAWMKSMADVGMSHILDTVPNHMGVASDENLVWNDMLEDGPSALHGRFFDVAWTTSPRPELKDRILIPTLGETYGTVLEKGEFRAGLSADGGFYVAYYDRHFPISPESYDAILTPDGSKHADDQAVSAELAAIIALTRDLLHVDGEDAPTVVNRDQQKREVKSRIKKLMSTSGAARTLVEANFRTLNGTPGNPASFDGMNALLARQHYRLAYWRTASDEINYRRFFDVSTLAALAMERHDVFLESHDLIFSLIVAGHIDGLRIDHSDGLYDPKKYFLRLQRAFVVRSALASLGQGDSLRERFIERVQKVLPDDSTDQPLYVVTEKILAPAEPLPKTWAMAGTSGYDILNEISGLFVDPSGEQTLSTCYHNFVGAGVDDDYHELAHRKKGEVLANSFAGELNLLAHQLDRLAQQDRHSRDFTLDVLRDALRETIACFGVYRTYVSAVGPSERDVEMIEGAIARATGRDATVEPCVYEFLRDLLLLRGPLMKKCPDEVVHFVGKFQQLTSPVTAKGLEDTAFYIYHRLTSLNEVGGEPSRFGVSSDSLHETFAARQRDWPRAMSVLSTHDTKRAEDVRARIHVLSELADEWSAQVGQWRAVNRSEGLHPNDEYLLYQTLIGAWPNGEVDAEFIERINAYMLKAMREAKVRTSWTAPSETTEHAMKSFIDRILDAKRGRSFLEAFLPFQQRVARVGMVNALAQTLLRLTAPGVPDTYQGTELWDLSLVDPDNRRPVDYALRERLLAALPATPSAAAARGLVAAWADGRAKLLVTATALRLRRERPSLFLAGDYTPLRAQGERADSVFAFARREGSSSILTIVPRLITAASDAQGKIDWRDTRLDLPTGVWRNALTGELARSATLNDLLSDFPVALLVRADSK